MSGATEVSCYLLTYLGHSRRAFGPVCENLHSIPRLPERWPQLLRKYARETSPVADYENICTPPKAHYPRCPYNMVNALRVLSGRSRSSASPEHTAHAHFTGTNYDNGTRYTLYCIGAHSLQLCTVYSCCTVHSYLNSRFSAPCVPVLFSVLPPYRYRLSAGVF